MTETMDINCGTGDAAYTIALTGAYANIFELVKAAPAVHGKEGEELLAAIRETVPDGITEIKRLNKDGKPNDGPHGEPAVQTFKGGKPFTVEYVQNGLSNDGPNGEPAYQEFGDDGSPRVTRRYKNGALNDGPNGEPAFEASIVLSHWGRDYKAHSVQHFKDGLLNDGLHGEPAKQLIIRGLLDDTSVEHYKNGEPSNGANGEPAIQKFNVGGRLTEAWKLKDNGKKKALGYIARRKAQKKFGLTRG